VVLQDGSTNPALINFAATLQGALLDAQGQISLKGEKSPCHKPLTTA
jgi:hypothetical protein